MPFGLPLAVMTTISFAEKTTDQAAAFFVTSSLAIADEDGANTSQVSPLRMRSASWRDVLEVRLMVTPVCFASNAF